MLTDLLKKNYILLLFIIYGSSFGECPEVKMNWHSEHHTDNNFKKHLNTHFSYNIRTTAPHHSNNKNSYIKNNNYNPYIGYMSVSDFEQVFRSISNQYEILSSYQLYAYPNFCTFARSLSCYKEFIITLAENIKNNPAIRSETACIPGFAYDYSWGKETSEFHDFIHKEANSIRNNQSITQKSKCNTLHINESHKIDSLINKWSQSCKTNNNNINQRSADRINALNITQKQNGKCFDYSSQVSSIDPQDPDAKVFQNTYGTHLDYQLHTELCQTRNTMRNLEQKYYHDHYVNILAPVVYHYTAQAKTATCPIIAFELSDFCHIITQVLSHGMNILYDTSSAIGKGAWKGAQEFASIEHWQNMVTGTMQLGLLFADAIGQENALHYALVLDATSKDSQAVVAAAKKYCNDTQKQKDALNLCAQATYKKIQSMSWQEVVEHGAEIGTSMILDALAFNTINGFSTTAGNLITKQLNGALESGVLLTEQYAVEVAGFGKLIIEEGPAISSKAADVIKNDLTLLSQSNKNMSSNLGNIANNIHNNFEHLLKSAMNIIKGNNTSAGRAFQKHATREGSAFIGEITGNATKNTEQGINYINKIIKSPDSTFIIRNTKSYGDVLDIRLPDGMGARWTSDGTTFIGFLEKYTFKQ